MAGSSHADELLRVLDEELARGLALIAEATGLDELDGAETAVLGRKARFSEVQRSLGGLSEEDRRRVGMRTNEVRETLRSAISERRAQLEAERERAMLEAGRIDVTLPGRRPRPGSLHPLTIAQDQIVDIFARMGYRVVEGPEVEDEWHNFDALNIPPDHPARTMMDTTFVGVPGFHRPDLHGGGVGAQHELWVAGNADERRVHHGPGGMIGRDVQRIEVVPFVLNLWAFHDPVTHSHEDVDDLLLHDGQGMERPGSAPAARQGDV